MKTTTLQNVEQFTADEFCLTEAEYLLLREAQRKCTPVTVDCEATPGYFDITLQDGTEYAAVSAYHLRGY